MRIHFRARVGMALLLGGAAVAGLAVVPSGCSSSSPPRAVAARVESRDQLIGGRRALGEVGDYKLSNGIIQAIVQQEGDSRGFGAFGGSLIDLDLVRGGTGSSAKGGTGNDHFTEMFPAFFLQAVEPTEVKVLASGEDGGPAVVRVSGKGAEFMSLTKGINELVIGKSPLEYHVDYILEPGKQYLKITTTITNPDRAKEVGFPLSIPFGFITLLGEGQRLFVPGKAGYDMRFRLDEVYKQPSALEAFPGEVTSMVATEGEGVSYAVAASPRGAGYLTASPKYYPTAKSDSLLVPMASGSFLATFWGKPPTTLPPQKSYSFSGYVAVGSGDVASAQKVVYGIEDEAGRRKTPTGTLSGRVREEGTRLALAHVAVVFEDAEGSYVGSARTGADGTYSARVPPGRYRAIATDAVRTPARSEERVDVEAEGKAELHLTMERAAYLSVSVRDERGRPLPAKISVEGSYDHEGAEPPRQFLYDLKVGERMRPSDLDPDGADPESRRYLERIFFAPKGFAGKAVRPGRYRVWVSRGPEYDLASAEVELGPNERKEVPVVLRQVLPTPGWVSSDWHVHSINSVDSEMALPDRVASYAVEGVDVLAATDHNVVSDFTPAIEALGISDWVRSFVGLELSTLEMGHFNAFPIRLEPGPVRHGSFDFFRRPPGTLFAQLRGLGKEPERTLVQVNHPRDSIQGYFSAFNLGTYTGTILPHAGSTHPDTTPLPDGTPSPYAPESFSFDFDVLEVYNGKRMDMNRSYRVPATPPPGPEPTVPIPPPGTVLEQLIKVPTKPDPGPTDYREEPQPVYPGVLDDYYTLSSKGRRITAVGNSDSHSASAEAGLPRTYLKIGGSADGSMRGLNEEALFDALRTQQAMVTNGPFVELEVNGVGIGGQVVAPDGKIDVRVKVQAAPWVDVTRVLLKRGGKDMKKEPELLAELKVPASGEVLRLEETRSFTVPDGSWVMAEVEGERSMWPVYVPYEVPSILLNEVVGSIGASFGFGNKYGKYQPQQVQQVKPFAFTNPIWVDRVARQPLKSRKAVLPLLEPDRSRPPGEIRDLRRLFGQFHSDVGE